MDVLQGGKKGADMIKRVNQRCDIDGQSGIIVASTAV